MKSQNQYMNDAVALLSELGVYRTSIGTWAFTDVAVASGCYIHHSRTPVALAAYAAVDPIFAAGRIPNYTLVALVDKIPCMDGTESTALALICDAEPPTLPSAALRGEIFGNTAWQIVRNYQLESCFIEVEPYGSQGSHFTMRPQGYDYQQSTPIPASLKTMRKAYRSMAPVQQIMVLTLIHLYCPGPDKFFLTGGCPTQIPAAKALATLRNNGQALKIWAHLLAHYAGW
ncbi:hypothetical protein PSH61_19615 [Pseudomonas rhodesiae]|uniref:hypothetical protein n=1 Tax=Pseudomonas TaxID=286 RepID=UPI002733C973|nr:MULTISPECIES: hypothetical protein [Pseudomonas]MEA1031584.1 hypothetical protein [Pseudomonas sp. N-137]WLI28014.1 hypothetical protein PSH61_19615 [Pseudomonas rhodesiae]